MMKTELRFAQYVDRAATSECWLFTGARVCRGYGKFTVYSGDPTVAPRQMPAHRYAWEKEHGSIPDGMCVLHRCDNPPCVNPSHLFLGTRAENSADMVAKGRQARGERHWNAKLTEDDVAEIRRRVASGERQRTLARAFGVSNALVCLIVNGRKWKQAA